MTFRLFIYYCALSGAWAALFGWALGRMLLRGHTAELDNRLAETGLQGLCLGLFVSLSLSLIDALWNLPLRRLDQIGLRVTAAVMIGSVGGMVGGVVGQVLYGWNDAKAFVILGWSVTGLLIGASVGVFELLTGYLKRESLEGTLRKIRNGVLGGAVGGLLGGTLTVLLHDRVPRLFADRAPADLWSPSATGFVALGLCIGLLIGLAQVFLKEAWVRIEAGRRAGRDVILSKAETVIGRAESCDIGLFGENGVERAHARIVQEGHRYVLEDLGTPGGTFVNGLRIAGRAPLRDGDAIKVGGCVLRFGERQKSTA